eukprot:COSAG01_NODE_3427_length_6093_cov_9.704943_2_plen_806_part_00
MPRGAGVVVGGRRRDLSGNPDLKDYSAPSLSNLGCSAGFYESRSMCIQCESGGGVHASMVVTAVLWLVAVIAGGWLLWRIVGSDWRPDVHSNVSCVVHYGHGHMMIDSSLMVVLHLSTVREQSSIDSREIRKLQAGEIVSVLDYDSCDGHARVRISDGEWVSKVTASGRVLLGSPDYAAGLHWFNLIDERLQEDAGSVRLDHPEFAISRGDEVQVSGDYHKKRLRGAHGTVIAVQGRRATVAVHGKGTIKAISLAQLELLAGQQSISESTALCFCLGNDWCQSASFPQDILDTLSSRAFDAQTYGQLNVDSVADLPSSEKGKLMTGCVFVLCGEDVLQSAGYQWLRDTMLLSTDRFIVADARGQRSKRSHSSEQDVNATLGGVEAFLEDHEGSSAQREKAALESAVLAEEAQAVLAAVRDSGKQLANLSKIVSAQLQQCLAVLAIDLHWSDFLIALRDYVASIILLDLFAIARMECAMYSLFAQPGHRATHIGPSGDSSDARFLQTLMLLCIGCGLCGCARCNQYRWKHYDNASAGARATHLSNFGWALYTMLSPAAVSSLATNSNIQFCTLPPRNRDLPIAYSVECNQDNMRLIILGVPAVLICVLPAGFALHRMRIANHKGLLRSRGFEAQYGWLCARYRPACYWWEILYLEARFATIAAELMLPPITAALVILGLSATLLCLSIWLRPFEEMDDEATSWRTSANRQATIAYVCQLVVVSCGLISHMDEDEDTTLDFVICAVVILALFLPLTMSGYLVWWAVRKSTSSEPQPIAADPAISSTQKPEDKTGASEFQNPMVADAD